MSIIKLSQFFKMFVPGLLALVFVFGAAGCSVISSMIPGGSSAFSVEPNYKDLVYAPVSATQKLDLYIPTTGTGPFPVVINIHGGGFRFGDKGMLSDITGKALLTAGYAVASIDYRLSGVAQFPAAVQDAKAAVRFLRANAAQYNLNPDKIAVFGQSAGGNIAAMVGVTGNISDYDDASLGNAGISSAVQAVVDQYGPTDFLLMDAQAKAQGCTAADQKHNDAGSFESAYIGAAIQTVPEQVKKSNPITYISATTPPFLIQKGDQDCTVPVESTKMLANALSAAKLDSTYTLLAGAGHGGAQFETDENVKLVIGFLDKYLK
jgi:acetyl esterase/lipase